ncbi:MAG: sulfite exporter TauE/SafE family protein [Patescibacteria group bacterium]|nr:sulfite exporter TauE/SafE family protein [Patescibacteria group bacterium]
MKKTILKIKGMHCPSCNILIEDKFKTIKNIKDIKTDYKTQKVELYYSKKIDIKKLDQLINPYGYKIIKEQDLLNDFGGKNNWLDFIFILILLIISFFILKEVNLIPEFKYQNLSLFSIFFLGIIASFSTCMATTGVIYLSIAKNNNNFLTGSFFSLGRIFAYGLFGFIFGLIGKQIVNSVFLSGILTLIIGLLMIFLGLELARIFNWQKFFFFLNSSLIYKEIKEKVNNNSKKFIFLVGFSTYFLPCGFTQSIQFYSMGLADPFLSSLNMIIFSIGTMPIIFIINQIQKIKKTFFYEYFMKFIGVLIFMIGLTYIINFSSLFGINIFDKFIFINNNINKAKINKGIQEIYMEVDSNGYSPNNFVVKKGIPVIWKIIGKNVLGCQGYFVVPKLGINQILKEGENMFEFIPNKEEEIGFSCGMGMYRGYIKVIN